MSQVVQNDLIVFSFFDPVCGLKQTLTRKSVVTNMLGTNIHQDGEESHLAPSEVQLPQESATESLVRHEESATAPYTPGCAKPACFYWKRQLTTPEGDWIPSFWPEDFCLVPRCKDERCQNMLIHGRDPRVCRTEDCYEGMHNDEANCHSPRIFWRDEWHDACGKDFLTFVILTAGREAEQKLEPEDGGDPDVRRMAASSFMNVAAQHMGDGVLAGNGRWLTALVRYLRYDRGVYWHYDVDDNVFAWLENDGDVLAVDIPRLLGYVCDGSSCRGGDHPWNERYRDCPFIHVPDYDRFEQQAGILWDCRTTSKRLMTYVCFCCVSLFSKLTFAACIVDLGTRI